MSNALNARKADHPVADLFVKRWSPRAFTGERIPVETLNTLFEAVRWAPSSNNSQPWRFLYGHRGTPDFDAILGLVNQRNQRWARSASVLIVLVSKRLHQGVGQDKPTLARNHSLDAGAAWAHLALQASLSGWAAHAIGGFDHDAARQALDVPEDFHVDLAIAIGKQTDASVLPEDLRAREAPNGREKIAAFAHEGRFPPI